MRLIIGCIALIQIIQATVMLDMIREFKKLRARIEAIESSPYVVPPSEGRQKKLPARPFSKPVTSEKISA